MPEEVLAATTFGVMKTELLEYPFPEIPYTCDGPFVLDVFRPPK
jgi:hypothetical protein